MSHKTAQDVALVGLLSSSLAAWNRKDDVRTIASQVRGLLERAKVDAITRARITTVDINVRDRKVAFNGKEITVPTDIALTAVVGGITVVRGDHGAILFRPDGTSTGGEIVLASKGRRTVLRANWLTGLITVDGDAR